MKASRMHSNCPSSEVSAIQDIAAAAASNRANEAQRSASRQRARLGAPWFGACAAGLALIASVAAQAQPTPSSTDAAAATEPLWELGAGMVAIRQQAYPGANQSVTKALPFPYLIYRGEWLRADRSGLGLRAFESPNLELDVGLSGALGSSSKNIEARRGMANLGTLIEVGPRLTYFVNGRDTQSMWKAEFALRGVLDVNDRLAFKGWSLEPRLVHEQRSGPWRLGASLGAIVGDERLNGTYYGVAPSEATANRPAYDARAGLVAFRLAGSAAYQVNPKLRVLAYGSLNTVAGAANRASPLVKQRDGNTIGMGILYTWAESETRVAKLAP
jgi:outer membrane protein